MPLTCFINCLAARNLVLNFPLFLHAISTEKTFKFNKKTGVYKLPRGAIYKLPRVQLINNPLFAIHQAFALSKQNQIEMIPKCFRLRVA